MEARINRDKRGRTNSIVRVRPTAMARGPKTINRDRSMMLSYITINPDCQRKTHARSLDDLVGTGEEHSRYVDPRGLRGPEIDDQLIFGRRLHGHVRGLLSPQNAVDVAGCKPELVSEVGAV